MCVAVVDNVLPVEPAESNDLPQTCIKGLQGTYLYLQIVDYWISKLFDSYFRCALILDQSSMGWVVYEVGGGRGGGGRRWVQQTKRHSWSSHGMKKYVATEGLYHIIRLKRYPTGSDSNSRSLPPNWCSVLATLPDS